MEHLFHFQRAAGPANRLKTEQTLVDGRYNVLDLKRCEVTASIPSDDPYDYVRNRPLQNFNGVIRYADKNYIFRLRTLGSAQPPAERPSYWLDLYRLDGDKGAYCAYSSLATARAK